MGYKVCDQCQFPKFDDIHTGVDGVCEIMREGEVECFVCSKVKKKIEEAFTYNRRSICWECYGMKGGGRVENEWCEGITDIRVMCLECLRDMEVYEILPWSPVSCAKCSSGIFADRWEVNLSDNGPHPEYLCPSCCDPRQHVTSRDFMCKNHIAKFEASR